MSTESVHSRGSFRRLLVAVLVVGLALALSTWAVWEMVHRSGRVPIEFLDYVDRRMEGDPWVEALAAPAITALRDSLDAPPLKHRVALRFEVPPPPPRRGAMEIDPPEPIPVGATVWRVGPQSPNTRIADAASLAKNGDVVEIEAGDYFGDVTSWHQKRLTIRGVNGAARIYASGRIAEGKAIWVIKDGDIDIANIDFIGARASDKNGAGIRLERGRLRIRDCIFWDNETGVLTAGVPYARNTSLEIEDSEFAYSHVNGGWAHNLYVGAIDRLRVTGSYFHHASRGHLIKSRAAVSEILYSRLTDESGGSASYEANFPNGGRVLIVGNIVQQQQGTENGILISYGEEGYSWPQNELVMASNTLVNDHPHGGAFLRVAQGASRIESSNNLLVGLGGFIVADAWRSHNDLHATWADLVRPARQDYRIAVHRSNEFHFVADVALNDVPEALPRRQYRHPRQSMALEAAPTFAGALQPHR